MHRVASPSQLRPILIVTGIYLFIAAISIIVSGNTEFMIYLAVMALIITAMFKVHHRAGLSVTVLWLCSLWGLMHMVGGLVPIPEGWHDEDVSSVVYNWRIIPDSLKYDQVVHGYGVALTTWICWQVLSRRVRGHDGKALWPTPGMLALCATAGMGFGALNEVVEFVANLILPRTNIGGYINTGWDLVANLVGAVVVAVTIHFVARHRLAKGELEKPSGA